MSKVMGALWVISATAGTAILILTAAEKLYVLGLICDAGI